MQKTLSLIALGALSLPVARVSADALTEYNSQASWDSAVTNGATYEGSPVTNVASYQIPGPLFGFDIVGTTPIPVGPGVFTAGSVWGTVWGDYAYSVDPGRDVFSDSPGQVGGNTASVTVTFKPSEDVTALLFHIGTFYEGDTVDILVNHSLIAPVTLSGGWPGGVAYVGVTDTSGPITSIKFTEGPGGHMDLIGGYSIGSAAVAPEMDPKTAVSGLAFLLGTLAVVRGRRRRSLASM
jgi:hypothetical protein